MSIRPEDLEEDQDMSSKRVTSKAVPNMRHRNSIGNLGPLNYVHFHPSRSTSNIDVNESPSPEISHPRRLSISSSSSSSPPPAKKSKPNNTDKKKRFAEPNKLVTFVVGQDAEEFLVHHERACYHSPVLKAAFVSDFLEGQSQSYILDDTSAQAMQLLVQFLYSSEIDVFLDDDSLASKNRDSQDFALVEAWVLADKLLIPKMQNQIIKGLQNIKKKSNKIPTMTLNYIWKHTVSGSSLRRLMLDWCAYHLRPDAFAVNSTQFPQEMLIELVTQYSSDPGLNSLKLAKGKAIDLKNYGVPEEKSRDEEVEK